VIASNNLTNAGWRGGNAEAFVRLVGDAALCEPLWDWAGAQAQLFDFPDPGIPKPEPPLLEKVRDELHTTLFRLEEPRPGAPSHLIVVNPSKLELPEGVRLEVARYTKPSEAVPFPNGANSIDFPSCTAELRTRFLVCTLHHEAEEMAWIASADLDPPLGDQRDRELVARLLGPREFLAYLQSLRSEDAIVGTVEGQAGDDPSRKQRLPISADTVHLEGLLKQLARDPRTFEEMDRAILRYGELIKKGGLSSTDRSLLSHFLEAWTAISEAFR
jgi:hypothetical protein